MLKRKLEPDVAIEFPVDRIAGISFRRAPDLPARIAIARERRRSSRRETGRVNRAARPGVRQHETVRVHDEPPDIRFTKDILDTRMVSAFRQPKPGRIGLKRGPVRIATDQNLRAHRFGRLLEQRQQSMGRSGGHQLEATLVPQPPKYREQVAVPLKETLPASPKMIVIKL